MNDLVKRSAHGLGILQMYHYRPFNAAHLISLMRENVVRYSNPAAFNDPWDCRPHFATKGLENEQVRERHAQLLIKFERQRATSEGRSPPDEAQMALDADQLCRDQERLRQFYEDSEPLVALAIREQWRIYCMTTAPDHPLMWSHYAAAHRGLCLQFGTGNLFGSAFKVGYSSDYPEVDLAYDSPQEVVCATLLTKAQVWAYENEFRAVEEAHDCRDGCVTMPPSSLQAVIVGCQMPDDERKAVKRIVEKAGRQVELKQAVTVAGRYALKIIAV